MNMVSLDKYTQQGNNHYLLRYYYVPVTVLRIYSCSSIQATPPLKAGTKLSCRVNYQMRVEQFAEQTS